MKTRYIVIFSALFAVLLFVIYIVGAGETSLSEPKVSMEKIGETQTYLRDILEQIRNENGLIDNRFTWMLTLQGLFLASLSFLLKDKPHRIIAVLVCFIGFITCVTFGCSIVVGMRVLNDLNPAANSLGKVIAEKIGVSEVDITGNAPGVLSFLLPWRILPWFFAYVWVVLAIFIWKIMPQKRLEIGSSED